MLLIFLGLTAMVVCLQQGVRKIQVLGRKNVGRQVLAMPEAIVSLRLFCAWSLFLGMATIPWVLRSWHEDVPPKLPRAETEQLLAEIADMIHAGEIRIVHVDVRLRCVLLEQSERCSSSCRVSAHEHEVGPHGGEPQRGLQTDSGGRAGAV